jgi:hypothetical protein
MDAHADAVIAPTTPRVFLDGMTEVSMTGVSMIGP